MKCRNCGEIVLVSPAREPVRYVERPAEGDMPRSLLIIGGDWLLHRCVIAEPRVKHQ